MDNAERFVTTRAFTKRLRAHADTDGSAPFEAFVVAMIDALISLEGRIVELEVAGGIETPPDPPEEVVDLGPEGFNLRIAPRQSRRIHGAHATSRNSIGRNEDGRTPRAAAIWASSPVVKSRVPFSLRRSVDGAMPAFTATHDADRSACSIAAAMRSAAVGWVVFM